MTLEVPNLAMLETVEIREGIVRYTHSYYSSAGTYFWLISETG